MIWTRLHWPRWISIRSSCRYWGYWRHTLARDCHCRGRRDHLLHLPRGEVLQGRWTELGREGEEGSDRGRHRLPTHLRIDHCSQYRGSDSGGLGQVPDVIKPIHSGILKTLIQRIKFNPKEKGLLHNSGDSDTYRNHRWRAAALFVYDGHAIVLGWKSQ